MGIKELQSALVSNFPFLKFTITKNGFKASNGHTGIGYVGHYLDKERFQELEELEQEGIKHDYGKYNSREIQRIS